MTKAEEIRELCWQIMTECAVVVAQTRDDYPNLARSHAESLEKKAAQLVQVCSDNILSQRKG